MDWSVTKEKSRRICPERLSRDSFSSSSEDGAASDKESDEGIRRSGRSHHSDGENSFDSRTDTNDNKRRHRRGRKRQRKQRVKPYNKSMSWVEREHKNQQTAEKASRVRDKQARQGKPGAPFNTTSFLMNEHNNGQQNVVDVINEVKHSHPNHQDPVSDAEYYSSPEDENDFLEREFSETYASVHAENLSQLCKEEVINELLTLEAKFDKLKKEFKEATSASMKEEVKRLRLENQRLRLNVDYQQAHDKLRSERLHNMSQHELVEHAQKLERLLEQSNMSTVASKNVSKKVPKKPDNICTGTSEITLSEGKKL